VSLHDRRGKFRYVLAETKVRARLLEGLSARSVTGYWLQEEFSRDRSRIETGAPFS